MSKRSLAPYAWMLCGCVSFAWMAEFASHLGHLGCDWRLIVLARSGLAFVFALGLAYLAGARLVLWKPPVLWMRSIAGSVSMLCTFFAFAQLRSCEVLTLTNTFPIWVALLSWPLMRVRPAAPVWVAAACGVLGVVLIQLAHFGEGASFGNQLAVPLALTAAFTSAVAMLGLNRLKDIHPWAIVAHFSGVATLFALGSWFVGEPVPAEHLKDRTFLVLLLGVGVTATFGQMCLTRAFTAGDPGKVSVVCLTQIVFAFGLHLFFGGEKLELSTLAGIACVMAPTAWVMLERSPNEKEKRPSLARSSPRRPDRSRFMSKADSPPARRPITPLILVALGVALYFMGWLIVLAPKTVPMMAAIWATMFGPLACLLLLAGWFVLRPVVASVFRKAPRQEPAAEEVAAAVADGHAGSTDVHAPRPITSAAPAPFTLDPDAPPRSVLRDGPSPWRAAAVRAALVVGAGVVCAGALAAADKDTRFFFTVWGLPLAVGLTALTIWVLFHAPAAVRLAAAGLVFLAAVAPWELVRMEGVWGEFTPNAAWRWAPHAVDVADQFDRDDNRSLKELAAGPVVAAEADWTGFRGPDRDGIAPALAGTTLVELWDRPVGPGWGSVSGVGDLLFTQEQRKDGEAVVCYDLELGKARWTHLEDEKHTDGPAGPGPRGTPTFHEGRLYAMGGTGVLVCLDARSGERQWRAATKDVLDLKQATFGFACSPLVHRPAGARTLRTLVYVHPGVEGPVLAAFDARTGDKVWTAGFQKNESYSSPQLATLAGVEQVLVFGSTGLSGFDPATGDPLWHYAWSAEATSQPSVQPTLLGDDRVVIGGAQPGSGFRCVKITARGGEWKAEEAWKTEEVSPRFNDVVRRGDYLYGLDSGRLFCLDGRDGEVVWKTRGSTAGSGQVLLVGDRLLVQEERGRLAWYDATPDGAPKPQFVEALKHKTWNHPSLVRGRLVVRNGKRMICYRVTE